MDKKEDVIRKGQEEHTGVQGKPNGLYKKFPHLFVCVCCLYIYIYIYIFLSFFLSFYSCSGRKFLLSVKSFNSFIIIIF